MQSVAQMWLVLHLTGSGVALGITTALQFTSDVAVRHLRRSDRGPRLTSGGC